MKTNLSMQRSVFLAIIFIISLQATSQVDQRMALADKYFDAGEYYTAAALYEQFITPPKTETPQATFPLNTRRNGLGGTTSKINRMDIVYKQAQSYRFANYWQEAAAKYKECFEKDFNKYADAFYWYAVCQRSLGKYEAAEEYLTRFVKINISNISLKQTAEKELRTVQFIRQQLTRPDTILFTIKKTQNNFSHEKGIFALNNINGNYFLFTSTAANTTGGNGDIAYHS